MAYTHSDNKIMRQSIDDLKKLAEPLFSSLNAIEVFDTEIAKAFAILQIEQEQPHALKTSSKKSTVSDALVHDLKKAHSFISLAVAADTGPQFKQLLSDQLIMQRDMLDMLREVVEKRTAIKLRVLEIPDREDLNMTEQDRKSILEQLNAKLSDRIHVDDATVVAQLNNFRSARELIMEKYVQYLTTALSLPAAQVNQAPQQKKVHIFSANAKDAASKRDNTPATAMRELLENIIAGAQATQEMAEDLITKVPKTVAQRLQLEQQQADQITDRATLLSANDQMNVVLRLSSTIQLACDLLHNYTRVLQEVQHATTGPRFIRYRDRALEFIGTLPQSVGALVDGVVTTAKANKQYKAQDFAEIQRRLTELQQLSSLRPS